jgi:AcrR family transcriptional regulator
VTGVQTAMFANAVPSGNSSHARGRLPTGRHGLSRSFVAQNQRDRILAAVADACSAKGYADMSVEDIIAAAGVSRRTFYEHFKNKEHAFLAAYDAVTAQLFHRVTGAVDAADTLPEKVRAGLAGFLGFLANEPAFAKMCIVDVLAAGPEAVARRDGAMRAFSQLITVNARTVLGDSGPPAVDLMAETVVGGIYEVVYARVLRGELEELPGLVADLVYAVLLPFAGPEQAAAYHRRLSAAPAAERG